MDGDEIETEEADHAHARRHDKWSIVILGLNYITQVTQQTSNFIGELTVTAAQHANQLQYDKKFDDIVRSEWRHGG